MTRRIVAAEGPDPIDIHVGARMRDRRVMLGLSQTALAAKLAVTFQQVQKYERGANRLSASQLWRAAEALQVDLSFFFAGLGEGSQPAWTGAMTQRQGQMLRALDAMSEGARRAFMDLAVAVAAERDGKPRFES